MARVPIYEEKVKPTATIPTVMSLPGEKRSPLTIPFSNKVVLEQMNKLGETITGVGEKLNKARDIKEATRISLAVDEQYMNTLAELEKSVKLGETKYSDMEGTFDERSKEIVSALMESADMTAPSKRKLQADIDGKTLGKKAAVISYAQTQETEALRADAFNQINTMVNGAVLADAQGDTKKALEILKQIDGTLDGYRSSTLISANEERVLREGATNDYNTAVWSNRINNGSMKQLNETIELLGKPEVEGLDEQDRVRFLEKAEAKKMQNLKTQLWIMEKKNEVARKERVRRTKENNFTVWQELVEKTMTLDNLNLLADERKIDLPTYKAAAAYLKSDVSFTNNPIIVGQLALDLESGVDIRERAGRALENKNIKPEKYIQIMQNYGKSEYSKGIKFVNNAMKPGLFDQLDLAKHTRHATAINYYDILVSEGMDSMDAAQKTVNTYRYDKQSAVPAVNIPGMGKYLDNVDINVATIDELQKAQNDISSDYGDDLISKDQARILYNTLEGRKKDLMSIEASEKEVEKKKSTIDKHME